MIKYIDDHLSLNIPRYWTDVNRSTNANQNYVYSRRTLSSVKLERDGKRAVALWVRYLLVVVCFITVDKVYIDSSFFLNIVIAPADTSQPK